MIPIKIKQHIFLSLAWLCILVPSQAQSLRQGIVDLNESVYSFLEELADKDLIVTPLVKPYNEYQIEQMLLKAKAASSQLSTVQQKRLSLYLLMYGSELSQYKGEEVSKQYSWHKGLEIRDSANVMSILPLGDYSYGSEGRGNSFSINNYGVAVKADIHRRIGLDFQYLKQSFNSNYFFSLWRKYTGESGFYLEPALVRQSDSNAGASFAQYKINFSYTNKWMSCSMGKNQFKAGYAESGSLILSPVTSPFEYLRLDLYPSKFFYFTYIYGMLNSLTQNDMIRYPSPDTNVLRYFTETRDKFYVYHSLTIQPFNKLQITIGESNIHSDKMSLAYLIPFNIYKVHDFENIGSNSALNDNRSSNTQVFATFSLRNFIPRTHFYGEFLLDELDLARDRRQYGFLLGARASDYIAGKVSFVLEYTRVEPFVYSNANPAQTFENYAMPLGHYLRNNFDMIYGSVSSWLTPQLHLRSSFRYVRQGKSYSIYDQYIKSLNVPIYFLKDGVENYFSEFQLRLQYDYKPLVHAYIEYRYRALYGIDRLGEIPFISLGFQIAR